MPGNDQQSRSRNSRLPNAGIFNHFNLSPYVYCNNNPITFYDPDGNCPLFVITGLIGAAAGAVAGGVISYMENGEVDWGAVAVGAVIGGAIGVTGGAAVAYLSGAGVTASAGAVWTSLTGAGAATTATTLASQRGVWQKVNEAMSAAARAYQTFITGTERVFKLNGVKFDGVVGNTLIEAKWSYTNFINSATGTFYSWFKGAQGLIDQATRQILAAEGSEIVWYFADQATLKATKILFSQAGIEGIKFVLKVMGD